jgi:PAS domain S-box-containing protein
MEALHRGIPAVLWTWVLDPVTNAHRYTYFSAGTTAMSGYTPEELISERQHFSRLVHPDDLQRVQALDARSNETGVWDATYRIVHRDGGVRWIHSLGWRGEGPEPEEIVWHGIAFDVTHEREEPAQASQEAGGAEAAPAVDVTPPA